MKTIDFSDTLTQINDRKDVRMIHCKLFGDKITDYLCLLRKDELHERGAFSCEGCRKRLESC
jgi:hypothetical protein